MSGEKDKALFYNYLNLFYDKMRDLEAYIKILEEVEIRLKQKRWESPETQEVVKKFRAFCRKENQYDPGEYNTRILLESKVQLYRHLQTLRDMLRKIKEFQSFLNKWR